MTPTRYEEVRRAFLDARGLPPAERNSFLARAADTDPELAREVQSLLAAVDAGSSFLESPAVGPLLAEGDSDVGLTTSDYSTLTHSSDAGAGAQVGPYRILRPVGEGGMGTVYESEQR